MSLATTPSEHGGMGLASRRALFVAAVAISSIAVLVLLGVVLSGDGLGVADIGMLICFGVTLPWTMIGFWNAVIGLVIRACAQDPVVMSCPPARLGRRDVPLRGRTAILMAVHDEDPERVFGHLRSIADGLDAAAQSELFELFVLSDTRDPAIAAREERLYAEWRAEASDPCRIHYRRRDRNTDHKIGNIWELLERRGQEFDYFIMLDADSLMRADLVHRLVRTMDGDAQLGILQPLIVGLPNRSVFARIFQLGMRHGMRTYATGSAWWQGDAGPFWGHNAILRTAAFMRHCRLPRLSGGPPLGGLVLSHDQVEAAQMRGAGYKVHVLADEDGSYEENPPTLQDFIKRDLRWCQGNMQYLRLLSMPGLRPMGRVQLALAILMYAAAPAWLAFMLLGLGQAVSLGLSGLEASDAGWAPLSLGLGIGLFAIMMTINLTPKIAGLIDVLLNVHARRAYGGSVRILASAVIEIVFSLFLGPIVAVSQTIFLCGLAGGRTIRWETQRRSMHELSWGEALRGLWPQTLIGAIMLATLATFAPAVLPWASPIVLSLLLAVPFAWLTSRRSLGRVMERAGICATPEEIAGLELAVGLGSRPKLADLGGERQAA